LAAIREAAGAVGGWRLTGCTLYATLEPCAMCAGALVNARVERLVFGARDPKAGFCGSLGDLVRDPRLNHRLAVAEGVLEAECSALLSGFFAGLRLGERDL
jgi:tRNA(adenine34) deaminase